MNWPWTNQKKELERRLKEAEEGPFIEIKNIDDFFDQIKNKKYSFWQECWLSIKFKSNDFFWYVYSLFKPSHQRIRKVIPRRWCDLSELTLLLNFEIIKSYVEEEMDSIAWDQSEHKLAGDWLRGTYNYITVERPTLQEQFSAALTIASQQRSLPYAERYSETNRIEALIDEKDKQTLEGLAIFRPYLWS